jgi:hypothetical protein
VVAACGDEVIHVSVGLPSTHADAGAGAAPEDAAAPEVDAAASSADAATPEVGGGPQGAGAGALCAGAPSGARVLDVPPDCRATICDGAGRAAGVVVAQSNAPAPAAPCLVGTCDALGRAGAAPRFAGAACSAGTKGVMCDGAGTCVECNHTRDCAPGLYCDASHHCGAAACTDLDCGGPCPPCDLGKRCVADVDCRSFACDASSATCVQSQCLDHVQDGNETDLDCGGGICGGCELGQGCLLDADCRSVACDAVTLKCVLDGCADNRVDGAESGVDCGGGACPACSTGQKCRNNLDCAAGHVCSAQKICT